MIRRIIEINQAACTGCGLCAAACHEGAIVMENGKARLLRDDYCDGLGDCLPACPAGAISFVEREAAPYDEAAVMKRKAEAKPHACPGSAARSLDGAGESPCAGAPSALRQWPVQMKLVPVSAPYFEGADLLIAADCSAYAYGAFHRDFIDGRVTLIGCPKLDAADYGEKLAAILALNNVRSITLVRMEVPCCGGLERAVENAIQASSKTPPVKTITLSADGRIIAEK